MILASIFLVAQQLVVVEPFAATEHLGAIQLDSSSQLHLVAIQGNRLRMIESGKSIEIPGQATLFTIVDYDGDGYEEFFSLSDGRALQKLALQDGELVFGASIVDGIAAMPPSGCHAAKFMQDFNGDGLVDLLLPQSDKVLVHINSPKGFLGAIRLGALSQLKMTNGSNLLDSVGRSISVPGLLTEDVSGDGLLDLVVSDGGYIRQYVATEQGFPSLPTRTLDTNSFAKDSSDYQLDLSNVSEGVAYLVQDKWADLDNDGDVDVMILADNKVRIFLGDENGINLDKEQQRLKISGNVVYLFPARIDKDDIPDLVIVRIQDVSVGKLLRAVILSFAIDIDFMAFKGKGDGTFGVRALRTKEAQIKGGSLLSTYKAGKEELSKMRKRIIRTCAIGTDGQRNDVIVLDSDGTLRVFADVIATPSVLHGAIELFLQQCFAGEGELSLEISTLFEWVLGRTSAMASLIKGKKPVKSLNLPDWETPHAMLLRDFDGDGADEALVLRQYTNEDGDKMLSGFTVDFN